MNQHQSITTESQTLSVLFSKMTTCKSSLSRMIVGIIFVLIVLTFPMSATETFDSPHQYIPQDFQDYFVNSLSIVLRQRFFAEDDFPEPQFMAPWFRGRNSANGSRVYGGADGFTPDNHSVGKEDFIFRYRDRNGDGKWNFRGEEFVWIDDIPNSKYDIGQDRLPTDNVDITWVQPNPVTFNSPDGVWGKQKGLSYEDLNGNGQWDVDEDVYSDLLDIKSSIHRVDAEVDQLINLHPTWTEATIVAAIGANQRLRTAKHGISAQWFQQQQAFLNLLTWPTANGQTPVGTPPTSAFPLSTPEAYLQTIPDTNRDDLVDLGDDLHAFGNDTGLISFQYERPTPQVYLPIGIAQWSPLPVHYYFVQGGFDDPKNTFITVPDIDENGIYQAYSFHTRARIHYLHLGIGSQSEKRIEVIRPRGNAVVFTFDWDSTLNDFKPWGYPIGINAERTYVLRDTTPNDHNDLSYELYFDSGIIHEFGDTTGLIQTVKHIDGRTADLTGITIDFNDNSAVTPKYTVRWKWNCGQLNEFAYTTRDDLETITTTLGYDANNEKITSLTKSMPEFSVSVSGNTITHANGIKIIRSETSSSATLKTTIPNIGSREVKVIYNSHDLPIQEIIMANGGSATTHYDYHNGSSRYDNGSPQWSKLKSVIHPNGAWEAFDYYNDTGWLKKTITPFKDSSLAAAFSGTNVRALEYSYDHSLSGGESADEKFLLERPRRIIGTVLGHETSRTYIAYTGDESTHRQCIDAGAAWGDPDNLETRTTRHPFGPPSRETPTGFQQVTSQLITDSTKLRTKTENHRGDITTTIINAFGHVESSKTENGAFTIDSSASDNVSPPLIDSFGRILGVNDLDGTSTIYHDIQWHGGPLSVTENDNSTSTYTYTSLGQVKTHKQFGITTTYDYDVLGNVVSTSRSEGNLQTMTSSSYDALSRAKWTKNELGKITQFSYSGMTVTTTYPDSTTRVEKRFLDRNLKEISGSAVHSLLYDYGVDPSDGYFEEIQRQSPFGFTDKRRTYYNLLGDSYKTTQTDGTPSPIVTSRTEFDDKGRVIKRNDADNVVSLTEYDTNNEISKSGIDTNQNGVLDSDDQVTSFSRNYTTYQGQVARKVKTVTHNSSNPIVSTSYSAVNGRHDWEVDHQGGVTYTQTLLGQGAGERTVIVNSPDGTSTTSQYSQNRLVSSLQQDAQNNLLNGQSYTYDGLGRIIEESDSATGTTSYTLDAIGQVLETTLPDGSVIEYDYDQRGRTTKIKRPDGTSQQYQYTSEGELKKASGAGIYPTRHTYDPRGLNTSLKTFQGGIDGAYPAVTTWEHENHTGRLRNKRIGGLVVRSYDHTDAGRIQAITENGVTTSYIRNSVGQITDITHSDSSPSINYTYDIQGRVSSMTDAIGTRSYTYNSDDQVLEETLPQIPGAKLIYTYDMFKRPTSLSLEVAGNTVLSHGYSYDDAGRLKSVFDGAITATYAYTANTNLLDQVRVNNGGSDILISNRSYDILNRLTSIDYTTLGTTVASYSYGYTPNNQRIQADIQRYNPDDPSMPLENYWVYGYDVYDQLVTANAYNTSDGSPILDKQFAYTYDSIGNRRKGGRLSPSGLPEEDYTDNKAFNQYALRVVPGAVHISGYASPKATVTVNGIPTTRNDEYYHARITVNNTAGPQLVSLEINAVEFDPNTGVDVLSTQSGEVFVPAENNNLSYNNSGDILEDERFIAEWNVRHQLTSLESTSAIPDNAKVRLEFDYDYEGRRIRKRVYDFDPTTAGYNLSQSYVFVYDDWNLIFEQITDHTTSASATTRAYLWGLDLSNSLQGAGGIGGMIATTTSNVGGPSSAGATSLPCYDGNGNIIVEIDAATGDVLESYEYSPFGRLIGTLNNVPTPFGFSTKYHDTETGFYYYGYRYYNPDTGRWLNRDPLEEEGGHNLYAFVRNDPISEVDPLGQASLTQVREGNLFYTWHLGWIDVNHAYKINKSLVNAWELVRKAREGEKVKFTLIMDQAGGKGSEIEFLIKVKGHQNSDDRKNQLLTAWRVISEQFETHQNSSLQGNEFVNMVYGWTKGESDKIPSSFSTEDLVSNLVQFYSVVDGVDPEILVGKYGGKFYSLDEIPLSVVIWKQYHKVDKGYNKWIPSYADHDYFLSKDVNRVSIKDEMPLHGAEIRKAHKLIGEYKKKFGPSRFPWYFQRYWPDNDGVEIRKRRNF